MWPKCAVQEPLSAAERELALLGALLLPLRGPAPQDGPGAGGKKGKQKGGRKGGPSSLAAEILRRASPPAFALL